MLLLSGWVVLFHPQSTAVLTALFYSGKSNTWQPPFTLAHPGNTMVGETLLEPSRFPSLCWKSPIQAPLLLRVKASIPRELKGPPHLCLWQRPPPGLWPPGHSGHLVTPATFQTQSPQPSFWTCSYLCLSCFPRRAGPHFSRGHSRTLLPRDVLAKTAASLSGTHHL